MKTKFILHGGFESGNTNEDNSSFYTEILKDAPENSKILLIMFAKDTERIPSSVEKLTNEFDTNKWQQNIVIEVAEENSLLDQIKNSNVIYINGGVSLRLLDVLSKYPDFRNSLEGKIIVGESAGANCLSTYFYSPHANEVLEGLGVLPIKMIPHYNNKLEHILDGVGENLELVGLPEYTYRVLWL